MLKKLFLLLALSCAAGYAGTLAGLNFNQALAFSIFLSSILGTLFFWDFRLSFVFIGTALLFITKTLDLRHFIEFASLEVILFLVGMMILVALLKEEGFFSWLVHLLLSVKNLTATKFIIILSFVSMLLACAIDEVTSIIFIVAALLEICNKLEVDPIPFLIISVLATNIGSAGTVLGNPIGILIASKGGLTFEDFLVKAFPLAVICLLAMIALCVLWYRRSIAEMDSRLKDHAKREALRKDAHLPVRKTLKVSLVIFVVTLIFISLHRRLEILWGLEHNVLLLAIPLIASGAIMIWKKDRARHYVHNDVEWWTLTFFMFLFAEAGALKYTGATDVLAKALVSVTGNSVSALTGVVLWLASIGSSVLDNVVLVSALIPVVQSFRDIGINTQPLWWALLFGGCLGGNITLVGSTANIVALGIMEKEKNIKVTFMQWFWIGLIVGVTTTAIVWAALIFVPLYRV